MKVRLWTFLVKIGFINRRAIHYIGGCDVLPAPLKGDEEQAALTELEQGSEEAKQLLIERNLRLVVFIARRFENTGINLEDLISIGTIGLIKGITTFDDSKGARLATYAARCVENATLSPATLRTSTLHSRAENVPIGASWTGFQWICIYFVRHRIRM